MNVVQNNLVRPPDLASISHRSSRSIAQSWSTRKNEKSEEFLFGEEERAKMKDLPTSRRMYVDPAEELKKLRFISR